MASKFHLYNMCWSFRKLGEKPFGSNSLIEIQQMFDKVRFICSIFWQLQFLEMIK